MSARLPPGSGRVWSRRPGHSLAATADRRLAAVRSGLTGWCLGRRKLPLTLAEPLWNNLAPIDGREP
ncbi:MAG: hypothetical protein M0Z84_00520 [Gammaproteobacteria bacterium]|nr:hypothetical protein [Gammaproteobacteria bacterium]